jgi:hypothetical protein
MASLRIRQRSDGSTYTAVLYLPNGKQTSSSFNDHAEAVRFQKLANFDAHVRRSGRSTSIRCPPRH